MSKEVERRCHTNERKFGNWEELSDERRYWYEVTGKFGYRARYLKEVNKRELTIRLYQEIYDNHNNLVEVHEKFPINKGHRATKRGSMRITKEDLKSKLMDYLNQSLYYSGRSRRLGREYSARGRI